VATPAVGANSNCLGRTEEGFALSNGFPFVIEDGPAAAHPANVNRRRGARKGSRLGLEFFLDSSGEAVGVTQMRVCTLVCAPAGKSETWVSRVSVYVAAGCGCASWRVRLYAKRS
jgi:hypothetical protein